MSRVGFVATTHDPGAHLAPFFDQTLPQLIPLYDRFCVVMTPDTHPQTAELLRQHGAFVQENGTPRIGESRRRCLEMGLEKSAAPHLHYCDLDRLLFWQLNESVELRRVLLETIPAADFTVLGRTARAFATHPPAQIETESITNLVFSHAAGKKPAWDVVAGSCAMSRHAAELLLARSQAASNATDAEWPLLIQQAADFSLSYTECEGLAFETDTFLGPDTFKHAKQGDNWRKRVILTRESVETTLKIVDRQWSIGKDQ